MLDPHPINVFEKEDDMRSLTLSTCTLGCWALSSLTASGLAQTFGPYGTSDTNVSFSVRGDGDYDYDVVTGPLFHVEASASAEADYESWVEFFGDDELAGKLEADVYAFASVGVTGTVLSTLISRSIRVKQRGSTVYWDPYSSTSVRNIIPGGSISVDLPPLELFSADVEKTFDVLDVFGFSIIRVRIGGNADVVMDADLYFTMVTGSGSPSVRVHAVGDIDADGEAWVEAVLVDLIGARVTAEPEFGGVEFDLDARVNSSGLSGTLAYEIGRLDLDIYVELIFLWWSPRIARVQAYERSASSGSLPL
jgi:hypothetical protein